jgi:hypothetical protein
VTAWCQSEHVELVDVEQIDTGDVSEGTHDAVIFGVDDAWAELLDVLSVSHLTFTGALTAGGVDAFDVVPGTDALEEIYGLLGLFVLLDVVGDDQRDFWDIVDLVALGHDEGRYASSSNSTGHSKSSLVDVTLFVPSPPGLQWSEHSTASTHVTKSSLTTSVGTTASDTWDTGNGSTSSPTLGTGLLTGDLLDSVSLSSVLSQVGVHKVDNVISNWCLEYGWGGNVAYRGTGFIVDRNLRPGGSV